MTRIFVTSIIWTLCLVSQSDAVHSLTATTSSSTAAAAAAAGAAVTSIRAAAATSTASAVWTVGVLRSGKESSHRIYSQGEMADDEKVDPTKIRVLDIVVYTFLFAIGAPANYKIIKCLIWTSNSVKLYRKSRHHFLLLNLAIADAIVLFIVLPTEVLWRVTASWRAGNIGCKLFQFFRVFGLYASSMILICISLDRYYAVVQPFKYGSAANRISRLLKASWILSAIFSAPQVSLSLPLPLLHTPPLLSRTVCVAWRLHQSTQTRRDIIHSEGATFACKHTRESESKKLCILWTEQLSSVNKHRHYPESSGWQISSYRRATWHTCSVNDGRMCGHLSTRVHGYLSFRWHSKLYWRDALSVFHAVSLPA